MSRPSAPYEDTSRWSYHVDDAYYAELTGYVARLDEDWPDPGMQRVHDAGLVLAREARLLDARRFDDWLQLFTDDCLYWVPARVPDRDPRHCVSHAFDDRRRLADRVFWLDTGLAFSQVPPSRTVHSVDNVEVLALADDLWVVRSCFAIHEFRAGTSRILAGRYGHVLSATEAGWRIRLKQVRLLDADAGHENLTLVM